MNNKEYVKKLDEAARKTCIPGIMDMINSTECRILVEAFGENPTPESLKEIYREYYCAPKYVSSL